MAKVEFLPAVTGLVRETSITLGLSGKEAQHFELVVEEACTNVIEHAFDPDELGTYDVTILRRPGQLVVAVDDRGIPFDLMKYETGRGSSLGVILMKAFIDEVHFLNRGHQGKRVELIKNLPFQDISAYVTQEEKVLSPTVPALSPDIPITVRPTMPEDSVGLARCIYRCYGYSYPNHNIYYPDRLKELLKSGLLLSYVAVNPEGEIIGHIAIQRNRKDAHIGVLGQAVVDPRYRGNGFLGQMIHSFIDYAKKQGLNGTYSEAVTIHSYSQKACLAIGGFETGVLLGFLPADMVFRKIEEETGLRRTAMLLYTSMGGEPPRDVYPPFHHEAIIRDIYRHGTLKRTIISADDSREQAIKCPHAEVNVRVMAELGIASIQVTRFGADLEQLVAFRKKELCLRHIDAIYVELPLADPAVQSSVPRLELLGFFFAGIVPEQSEGDVLHLQYLNNLDVGNEEDIKTASDFGKCLVEYVLKARNRAGGFNT